MRTTVDLNDELMRQAKRRAADEGLTFRELVEQALRLHLAGHAPPNRKYKCKLPTFGGGLQPGVSFDDWNALRDLMDGIG